MHFKKLGKSINWIIAAGVLTLAGNSSAFAAFYLTHCKGCSTCPATETFGYYPTTWSPWPGTVWNKPAATPEAKPTPNAPVPDKAPPPAPMPSDKPSKQTFYLMPDAREGRKVPIPSPPHSTRAAGFESPVPNVKKVDGGYSPPPQ